MSQTCWSVHTLWSLAAVRAVCLIIILVLTAAPAAAITRGSESINAGGGPSASASFKVHDSIGQGAIGPVAEGGGTRAHDGFWLTLPGINVPVEAIVFATLSESGSPLVRWSVASLDGIVGFNIYRTSTEDGPLERVNASPIAPESPGVFEDQTAWAQTTFWYEVRAVFHDGTEDVLLGSPAWVTTGGTLVLRLFPPRPNPMRESTTLSLELPGNASTASLVLYNVRGQRVRTLIDGPVAPGHLLLGWHGDDDEGRTVAAGVYFVRLNVDGVTRSQKLMVLR